MFRLLNSLMGFIAGLLLNCAMLASATLLFAIRKVTWYNPLTWGVPLHWYWDTILKAVAVGLPIWIVCFIVKSLNKGVTFQIFQTARRPRPSLNTPRHDTYGRQPYPDFAVNRIVRPETLSPVQLARTHNLDFEANPQLARLIADSGVVPFMSASQRQALQRSLGNQSDPRSN